jgi:preprotein translocase subunit SecD
MKKVIFLIVLLFVGQLISAQYKKTGLYLATPSPNDSTSYKLQYSDLIQYYHLTDSSDVPLYLIDTIYKGYNSEMKSFQLSIKFTKIGEKFFARLTEQYINSQLGFVINDTLLCAPTILYPISGGKIEIANHFTERQVDNIIIAFRQEINKKKRQL